MNFEVKLAVCDVKYKFVGAVTVIVNDEKCLLKAISIDGVSELFVFGAQIDGGRVRVALDDAYSQVKFLPFMEVAYKAAIGVLNACPYSP